MIGERMSGVLLHLSSLPSAYGIGDMGPEAFRFVEILARAGQSLWQVLPLNPTCLEYGNSPYHCPSVFAGNPLFVSPDFMVRDGYLEQGDIDGHPEFDGGRVDYEKVTPFKEGLLDRAYESFKGRGDKDDFQSFCLLHSFWLDDYAAFAALRRRMEGKEWTDWPPGIRDRDETAFGALREELREQIDRERFRQYLFFTQWTALKNFARERGVRFFGDLPIYPTFHSADVWTHPSFFRLDPDGRPLVVAGVPPDYFSKTGQLWGNPLYDWKTLREDSFRWWISRVKHNLGLFDFLRIDHFRGLVACWEVPAGDDNSVNGKWAKVPAQEFFTALFQAVPVGAIVAEDLGTITADVITLRLDFGIPGMKILLFAFGDDLAGNPYLPHNFGQNTVVYTGTHDNNTVRGWYDEEIPAVDRRNLLKYLGRKVEALDIPWELIRLAMSSVARMAVFPMQDLLGLGAEGRMNLPSTANGNWEWRVDPAMITTELEERVRDLTETYGRLRDGAPRR